MASRPAPDRSFDYELFVNNCFGAASFALLYYDYLLTLPLEVDRFWPSRQITWGSALFYANRYVTLLGHAPVVFQYFLTSPSLHICRALSSFHQYLAVAVQIIVGVIMITRTYALYACSKRVLAFLCASGLTVISYGIYSVMSHRQPDYTEDDLLEYSCLLPLYEEVSKSLASAWTAMLCFDLLIFSMTLYIAVKSKYTTNSPLIHILFRDGTVYFGVMLVFVASVIYSFHSSSYYLKGTTTTLTNVVSSVMTSRLMLNIRDPKLLPNYSVSTTRFAGESQLVFTTIVNHTTDNATDHHRGINTHTPASNGEC